MRPAVRLLAVAGLLAACLFLFMSAVFPAKGLADGPGDGKPAVPPSPLRLVPQEADVVVHLSQPRRLVQSVQNLDVVAGLLKLPAVKEQLNATASRRLLQLLAHFEKTLGAKYPDLLDQLAGGGIVLGAKFGGGVVLIVQGTDDKVSEKFFNAGLEVIESELARQEAKVEIKKGKYHGIEAHRIGDAYLARLGATIVLANRKDAMTRVLDLHRGVNKEYKSLLDHAQLKEASQLLPPGCLATAWLNMKPAHESEGGKALYMEPRDNSQLTVLAGGYIDILGRSPWICAGLAEQKGGFLLTVRAPRGREGMGADRFLHLPPESDAGNISSPPLLEPKDVLFSSSFYMDLANLWKEREKLLPKAQADGMTAFDKTSGRLLGGVKMSSLFESVGTQHRIVVTNQGAAKNGYAIKQPRTRIPAFAFVAGLRNEDRFARGMDTLLRFGALALTQQFKMQLSEEKHKDVDIVGYRFDEKAAVPMDVEDFRFNFSPCFARVGKQFIFCSTIELCRELVDLLQSEAKAPPRTKNTASVRDRYYSAGFASLLTDQMDALIAQTILDQAVPPAEAKKQVEQLIELVRRLGRIEADTHIEAKRSRYDIHIRLGK